MAPWKKSGLLAPLLLALSPPSQADIYDDAWDCASAVVDTVELGVTMGPKALKFVATQPSCVVRLGSPATAAPIGVVVGLANTGVLPSSQPQCSAKLYDTAAQPLAAALNASLGELGVLPDGAGQQLADIASGELAGEALTQIPGMSEVSGSLTCGCELVEAGLSVDSIEQVLDAGDNLGDACGGVVWDKAKEVAGDVVEFAGDAADEGIRQVSNLGDALAGQTQHMPYLQYFDQHWLPRVEDFATMEFESPGNWHVQQQWRQMWEPCVSYFDGHTQSAETARYTCDNMRSGGPLFPERNFGRLMYRRLFDYDVAVAVAEARDGAYAQRFADLAVDIDPPGDLASDPEGLAAVESQWDQAKDGLLATIVAQLYGVPTKESTHDGLPVHAGSPPALFEQGTVGARAQDYFSEVDVNQDRADAARAVQLAIDDMDLASAYVQRAADVKRDFFQQRYQFVLTMREHLKDTDLEQAEAWARQCPTQACRDQIASDFATCRDEVEAWYQDNAALISDFDSSGGRRAGQEWSDRKAACLEQARQTSVENRWHIDDAGAHDGPAVLTYPGRNPDRFVPRVTPAEDTGTDDESAPEASDDNRRRGREAYMDRSTGGTVQASDEQLEARRASREAAIEARSGRISGDSGAREVVGTDLPGCAAVRGMINPRVYVCGEQADYENCRRVVNDSNVRCQLGRR